MNQTLANNPSQNGNSAFENVDIEMMQLEYEQAIASYNYRDQLIPQEFHITFALIIGIVGIVELFPKPMPVSEFALLFFIGATTLFVLHGDLMSNTSVKRALRQRIKDIEELLKSTRGGRYAPTLFSDCIQNRKVTRLERALKPISSSSQIIWVVRLFLLCWIIYGAYKLGMVNEVRNFICA